MPSKISVMICFLTALLSMGAVGVILSWVEDRRRKRDVRIQAGVFSHVQFASDYGHIGTPAECQRFRKKLIYFCDGVPPVLVDAHIKVPDKSEHIEVVRRGKRKIIVRPIYQ